MAILQILFLIDKGVQIYSGLLVIYALLSWFPGAQDSFLGRLVARLCEPYLSLFDRLNLNIGMVSFNVMIGIIVLNLASGGLNMIILSLIG
ncbi:YggT family protein [Enterococcus sp. BWM-S5]|uniref:YggT family protein n=1 Tax=Enterococcus larvae TaxID=2794352 RepID=A0ABS4CGV1_9ENTE|nr:YggT family protein [Enterococcus larvae]